MTDFIDDYCRWFKLPFPDPDEEDEEVTAQKPTEEAGKPKKRSWKKSKAALNARERRKARRLAKRDGTLVEDIDQEERDELVASMSVRYIRSDRWHRLTPQKLIDKLPKSIFANRVMARISIQEEDWANAIAYAEQGRKLVKAVEGERGTSMAGYGLFSTMSAAS